MVGGLVVDPGEVEPCTGEPGVLGKCVEPLAILFGWEQRCYEIPTRDLMGAIYMHRSTKKRAQLTELTRFCLMLD